MHQTTDTSLIYCLRITGEWESETFVNVHQLLVPRVDNNVLLNTWLLDSHFKYKIH